MVEIVAVVANVVAVEIVVIVDAAVEMFVDVVAIVVVVVVAVAVVFVEMSGRGELDEEKAVDGLDEVEQ